MTSNSTITPPGSIMDVTSNSGDGFLGDSSDGGIGYGIGVAVGILILITTITVGSYFCTREGTTVAAAGDHQRRQRRQGEEDDVQVDDEHVIVGIDEATLLSFPKMVYSKAKANDLAGKHDSTTSCCSICLADYKSNDVVRLLPDCGHVFHQRCVDPWLRLHPTCPVCRTSPLPTPQSSPLADYIPMAMVMPAVRVNIG